MKAQVQLAESFQVVPESKTPAQSKLPKIYIQKFDGVKTDWPRFWGQFVDNVDKNQLAETNKLTYLQSYLTPKVSLNIQGLPYSAEGYAQAKEILQKKYGCEEGIVATFVKEIMDVPRVQTANYKRVREELYQTQCGSESLANHGQGKQC